MSNRLIRINELIQREISSYLRKHYQSEAATITITGAQIAADLKTCRVFVSVIGDEAAAAQRMDWLRRHTGELRREVGRQVVLKWTPELDFTLDTSTARSTRVLQLLDELDRQSPPKGSTSEKAAERPPDSTPV